MLGRIFNPRALDRVLPTRSAFSYSQFELAILSLAAQAIAYYARTGHWPKLAPHDTDYLLVWPT